MDDIHRKASKHTKDKQEGTRLGAFTLANVSDGPVTIRTTVPSGWGVANYPHGYAISSLADAELPPVAGFAADGIKTSPRRNLCREIWLNWKRETVSRPMVGSSG